MLKYYLKEVIFMAQTLVNFRSERNMKAIDNIIIFI